MGTDAEDAAESQLSQVRRQLKALLKALGLQMAQTSSAGFLVTDDRCNLAMGCLPNMTLEQIGAWIDLRRGVQVR